MIFKEIMENSSTACSMSRHPRHFVKRNWQLYFIFWWGNWQLYYYC